MVKYVPQVWLNIQRKSTQGLSISQFTLDLTGAVLSLLQLILDSVRGGDWLVVVANPAKFALSNVTIFFDLLFFFQHFYLYRGIADIDLTALGVADETDPLLTASLSRRNCQPPRDHSGEPGV